MPSPFPGMDPYLEAPDQWPGFHTIYIVALQRSLTGILPPGFIARPEVRVYIAADMPTARPDVTVFATAQTRRTAETPSTIVLADRVDEPEVAPAEEVEVQEPYLNIVDRRNGGQQVVTVIELLSPSNKMPNSKGWREYRRKQASILRTGINLLELDLLRGGAHTVYVPEATLRAYGPWDYLVTLSDASRRNDRLFWRISLRDRLPALHLPLTADVPPVRLDLQEVFAQCYDESGLGDFVDYAAEPVPPLSPEDAAWADSLLRERGLRP
jgi:hypothetical protein